MYMYYVYYVNGRNYVCLLLPIGVQIMASAILCVIEIVTILTILVYFCCLLSDWQVFSELKLRRTRSMQ